MCKEREYGNYSASLSTSAIFFSWLLIFTHTYVAVSYNNGYGDIMFVFWHAIYGYDAAKPGNIFLFYDPLFFIHLGWNWLPLFADNIFLLYTLKKTGTNTIYACRDPIQSSF